MLVDVHQRTDREALPWQPARELSAVRFGEPVNIAAVDARILAEQRPDVILLDGRSVRPAVVNRSVVRLRSAGARGIVLLLDPADLNVVPAVTSLGAADFILSTATSEEVFMRLRLVARGAMLPARKQAVAEDAGIELHWRTHEVSAGSTRIALTLRELQLLATLMERAGEVLTSQDIARLAWGKQTTGGGGFTAAYVCSLRKKLAWFGGRFGIRTVRGVGYRFVV